LAAETAGQAASAHGSAGSRSRAARSSGSSELLLRRSGGVRTPALRKEVRFLTERELEVAISAARGRPNREIASDLFISRRTVENHLSSVYAKLGISGRVELAWALGFDERGLRAG
jgi:DNA-binding NarL/FixJ family response regulator